MEQIRLDLIPGKSAPVCHASQYDVGRTIRLNLVEGGSEYSIPAGTTAEIHIRKPDNNIISATVTATQGNKYIDIETAEQWTACAGTNLCEIVLTNGGNVIGTINFILEVEMDPIDGGSASESVIYNIQALVDTAVALHTFLIHITETTMTESAADILDSINSNKILQVIYKPDANSLTTFILPLTLDSGARPDGIRALAFAGFWDSKLYAADIVLDSVHSTVTSLSTINGRDLDETGDFPIHIHNSTITETAGEVLDAMADGLRPYVIWTNNSQSNYTFTYGLAAVWSPDANTETLIFGCPITGAVRTIHVFINPTTRTYRSSIQIEDYSIPQIVDNSTSASSVWSSQKTTSELADKAEIADTVVSTASAWSSSRIVGLLPTDTAQGAIASFTDGADDVPVKSLTANIDYKDATGFSAVNVTRTGRNLLNVEDMIASQIWERDGGTFENLRTDNRSVFQLGVYAFNGSTLVKTLIAPFNTVIGVNIKNFVIDNTVGEFNRLQFKHNGSTQDLPLNIVFNKRGNFVLSLNVVKNDPTTVGGIEFKDLQIELGDTATAYEPYNETTSEIDLGGTIYGGSVDITNGTVTSTKAQDGTDLPEPVVTTINPTAINTLYGVNNIWSDTGNTSLEYRADIQKYIDKKIAEAVGGNRSLSLMKSAPEETEETKQEGDEPSER